VVIEEHGERGATLAHAAQVRGVTEHLGQRHVGGDHLGVTARRHALDLATARVEAADYVAHVLLGGGGFHSHDGFEHGGFALAHGFADGHGGRDLEGHLRGVDFVVGAVVEGNLHVHDGETEE